jgi:adenosylhomocysteine nucleosidase
MPKVAIVAALEREVWPIIRHWQVSESVYEGRRSKFYENDRAVLVCGGIGPEAARRATEAVVQLYRPIAVVSVGFAGALDPKLKVGTVVGVKTVVDAKDGSRANSPIGSWVLVSVDSVMSVAQKATLAKTYGAHAVDMEAASVARGAQARGIPFVCVKVISDEVDFEIPPVGKFVGSAGEFRGASFSLFALIRPWLWVKVFRLAKNSEKASQALCAWLDQYNHEPERREPSLYPALTVH